MQAVALIGNKKSGKTTLMLDLIEQLKISGLRVAAAKFTQHSLDREGSDTERLARSAHCVVGLGKGQSSIVWNAASALADLLPLLDSDILVVEGGRQLHWLPRVILPRSPEEAETLAEGLALAVWSDSVILPGIPSFQDPSALAGHIQRRAFLLPGLDCQACGFESCGQLAERILAGEAKPGDCQAVNQELVITVNGQEIPLNPFVRSIIAGSITGMLSSLKGFSPGSIDIHMEM